jgi:hypothetical protein
MKAIFTWLFHWFGQGLKLFFFALVATLPALLAYLPMMGLEILGLSRFPLVVQLVIHGLSHALALAIFTAVLHSQLKDHPLRSPKP